MRGNDLVGYYTRGLTKWKKREGEKARASGRNRGQREAR